MQVTIEKDELVLRIKLNNPPVPSASGKTLVVASSRGNITTTALVGNKPVIVGFNAYTQK